MRTTRDDLVRATAKLLEAQGYHATGLAEILAESGAPRGSLYYHFPGGKEELAVEAVQRGAALIAERVARGLAAHDDPARSVGALVRAIAHYVETSGYRAGGPLTTVALETVTSSERLNLACRQAFANIEATFAHTLAAGGFSAARAERLATFITASIEGATLLSRIAHTGEPLRQVADALEELLSSASRA